MMGFGASLHSGHCNAALAELRSRQGGRWVIDPLCNYALIGNRLITACGV